MFETCRNNANRRSSKRNGESNEVEPSWEYHNTADDPLPFSTFPSNLSRCQRLLRDEVARYRSEARVAKPSLRSSPGSNRTGSLSLHPEPGEPIGLPRSAVPNAYLISLVTEYSAALVP